MEIKFSVINIHVCLNMTINGKPVLPIYNYKMFVVK